LHEQQNHKQDLMEYETAEIPEHTQNKFTQLGAWHGVPLITVKRPV